MRLTEYLRKNNSKTGKIKLRLTEIDFESLDRKYTDKKDMERTRQRIKMFKEHSEKRLIKMQKLYGEIRFLRMQFNNMKKRIDYILKVAEHRR